MGLGFRVWDPNTKTSKGKGKLRHQGSDCSTRRKVYFFRVRYPGPHNSVDKCGSRYNRENASARVVPILAKPKSKPDPLYIWNVLSGLISSVTPVDEVNPALPYGRP